MSNRITDVVRRLGAAIMQYRTGVSDDPFDGIIEHDHHDHDKLTATVIINKSYSRCSNCGCTLIGVDPASCIEVVSGPMGGDNRPGCGARFVQKTSPLLGRDFHDLARPYPLLPTISWEAYNAQRRSRGRVGSTNE